MSVSPTNISDAGAGCGCEKYVRSACKDLSLDYEYRGVRYCVLHYPSKEKAETFNKVLTAKLDARNFDFRGVWFPEAVVFVNRSFNRKVDFSYAFFSEPASFIETKFLKADFRQAAFNAGANFHRSHFDAEADFSSVTFNAETNFARVIFSHGVNFGSAVFGEKVIFALAELHLRAVFEKVKFEAEANFDSTLFAAPADFREAAFHAETHFIDTTFGVSAEFRKATFHGFVQFEVTKPDEMFRNIHPDQPTLSVKPFLDLRSAKVVPPQRIFFDNLTLRPHWFVKVNAHNLTFSNVKWDWGDVRKAIKRLEDLKVTTPREALGIACRQLADNAEVDHLYEDASKFRFMAMEARRLDTWKGFAPWRLSWWYWLASGYGERIPRALIVFVCIWLLFALLYRLPPPIRCAPGSSDVRGCISWATKDENDAFFDSFFNSVAYTIEVMTLQKPDPRPRSSPARLAVTLCTVLGPLQGALLGLAIRRKFMR